MNAFSPSRSVEKSKLVVVGAVVTLIVAMVHSREFRFDVWSASTLLGWYGLSVLTGVLSGLVVAGLVGRAPNRIHRRIQFALAAVLGFLVYVLQVYLLTLVIMRIVPWQ